MYRKSLLNVRLAQGFDLHFRALWPILGETDVENFGRSIVEDFFRKEQKDSIPTPQDTDSALVSSEAPKQTTDEEDDFGITRESLDKQIAHSVELRVRAIAAALSDEKPAEITSVGLSASNLNIRIRWPFFSPPPSGDSGDWLGTSKEIKRLRGSFQDHLLEQNLGRKLSNLLYAELVDFLLRYVKAHRFGDDVVQHVRGLGQRRLAGRPGQHKIQEHQAAHIRREGITIRTTLHEIKQEINAWKKKEPRLKDEAIETQLLEKYDRDRYAFIRYFTICFRKLPARRLCSNGLHRNRRLSDPRSWSTSDLAALITQEKTYREDGIRYGLGEVKKLVTAPIRPPRTHR